jgi:hypothetical protein
VSNVISNDDLKALVAGAHAGSKGYHFFAGPRPTRPASASTFEALMYLLRFGTYVLDQERTRGRLSRLDGEQLQEACARVRRQRMPIGRPRDDDGVKLLVSTWRACRGGAE